MRRPVTTTLLVLATFCLCRTAARGDSNTQDWESVDLTKPQIGSRVIELSEENFAQVTSGFPLVVVWFYAPWCKQCKLIRDAYDEAATTGVKGVAFARIDCVKYPRVKESMGVYSYPALKVFRGERNRWLPLPKQRTAQMIVAAAAAEADGAYQLLDTEDELRFALFNQHDARGGDDDDHMHRAGVGEAAVVALLSAADGESAARFHQVAAGTDIKMSPTPFLATTRPELLPLLGVEALPVDHMAIVTLHPPPASAVKSSAVTPLLGGASVEQLEEWVVGRRVPLVVDFTANFVWGKRAASMTHVEMHGLLFYTAGTEAAIDEVRRAGEAFRPGSLVVFTFNASLGANGAEVALPMMKADGMMRKYGVGLKDCPRLIFLDQRLPSDAKEGRNVNFEGEISEAAVVAFLRSKRLREPEPDGQKDEL